MEPTTTERVTFEYTNMEKHMDEVVTSCVSIFYALPALCVVIRLGVLWHRGLLTGSFHRLVLIFGVNDLLNYFMQIVTIRLPYWGLLSFYDHIMVGFVPTTLFYIMFNSAFFQMHGAVLMALNRASCMLLAQRYERIWQSFGWPLVLLGPLVAQPLTYQFIIIGAQFNKVGPAVYLVSNRGGENLEFPFQVGFMCGCTIAFVLNVYTGFALYHRTRILRTKVQVKDVKFFYICVVNFFCQSLLMMKMLVVNYAEPLSKFQLFWFTIGPSINDLNSFLPIYALLFISRDVRKLVLPCWVHRRDMSVSMVSVTQKTMGTRVTVT